MNVYSRARASSFRTHEKAKQTGKKRKKRIEIYLSANTNDDNITKYLLYSSVQVKSNAFCCSWHFGFRKSKRSQATYWVQIERELIRATHSVTSNSFLFLDFSISEGMIFGRSKSKTNLSVDELWSLLNSLSIGAWRMRHVHQVYYQLHVFFFCFNCFLSRNYWSLNLTFANLSRISRKTNNIRIVSMRTSLISLGFGKDKKINSVSLTSSTDNWNRSTRKHKQWSEKQTTKKH